jgi:hypothetical protein
LAQTTTDSNGNYSFASLSPGSYRVQTERPGFKTNLITEFNVAPGENQANAKLDLGAATETVVVTGSAGGTLNTESAEVATVNTLRG